MQFEIELSELAETQYDNVLSYISNVLENQQAVGNVIDDFDDTIENDEILWNCVVAFQGHTFYSYSGLEFSYTLKRGKDGEYTKELWVDRMKNSKSLKDLLK